MERLKVAATVGVLVAVALGACGDDSPSGGDEGETPAREAPRKAKPNRSKSGGFTGLLKDTYDNSKYVCGSSSPAKVAQDFGISVNVHTSEGIVRIAEEYADGYNARHHQAAFEGCLDGLPNPR